MEFVVLLGGANSKIVGTFFSLGRAGSLEVFRKNFRPMVCGAASCIRIPFSSCRVFFEKIRARWLLLHFCTIENSGTLAVQNSKTPGTVVDLVGFAAACAPFLIYSCNP